MSDATKVGHGGTGPGTEETLTAPARAEAKPRPVELPFVDPSAYEMGEEIARGGMGRIVAAHDRRLKRGVAVKELLHPDPELARRFELEALVTAQLQHPAIVAIYEAGRWPSGEPFYAMKRVKGRSLDKVIAKATTLDARLALLPQLLAVFDALAYAHDKRIIHRDLKPSNVLVGDYGETVVIDWGLAKDLGEPDDITAQREVELPESHSATVLGAVMGTPAYMPPEQARGDAVDARADVYSLGAMLYHLLGGKPPYVGTTSEGLLAAVLAEAPPAITTVVAGVPRDLAAIIAKAMAREAAERYPTAKELAEELRRYNTGQLVASHEYSRWELVRRWVHRNRAAVSVAAVATLVLAVAGGLGVREILAERDTAREQTTIAESERKNGEVERLHAITELAHSQREQGRQLLLAGHAGRAAPVLSAAYTSRPDDPETAFLAALAVKDSGRLLAKLPGGASQFSPDGTKLAVGQLDGSVLVVDAAQPTQRTSLPALSSAITRLAFSRDGQSLAVASDGEVAVRGIARDAGIVRIAVPSSAGLMFTSDSGAVIVCGQKTVEKYDLRGRKIFAVTAASPHRYQPNQLDMSRDGKRFLAVTEDIVRVWDTESGAKLAQFDTKETFVYQALFDRSGSGVVVGGSLVPGVQFWSVATGKIERSFSPAGRMSLAWVNDDTLMADLTLISLSDGTIRTLSREGGNTHVAVIDAHHVVAASYDQVIRVFDIERAAEPVIAIDTNEGQGYSVNATSSGRVAIAIRDSTTLWNLATEVPTSRVLGTQVDRLVTSSAGDRLAVDVMEDGPPPEKHFFHHSALLDRVGGRVGTVEEPDPVFRPNSQELYTHGHDRVLVSSSVDGTEKSAFPTHVYALAFDPTGRFAVTAFKGRLSWRDADSWRETWSIDLASPANTDGESVFALAVADGRIYAGQANGTIRIVDIATKSETSRLVGHTALINTIVVGRDIIATGARDLTARIWSRRTDKVTAVLEGHGHFVAGVAISADERWVATAGTDEFARVWDAGTGDLVERLPLLGYATSVLFASDGHLIVAGHGGNLENLEFRAKLQTPAEVAAIVARGTWRLIGTKVLPSNTN